MSSAFNAKLEDIAIALGATKSRVVIAEQEYADAAALAFQAPATLEAGTYTFEVTTIDRNVADYVDADFVTLSDGTTDIGPPGQAKGRTYTDLIPFAAFRISKTGAVAVAAITFKATKNFTVNF